MREGDGPGRSDGRASSTESFSIGLDGGASATESVSIGPATIGEVDALPDIERRAATRFDPALLPPERAADATPLETLHAACSEGRLLVARTEARAVGFALLVAMGRDLRLEELDVEPAYGGRGIGTRLVRAVCAWARERGHARVVLATFRDVPWNAPFYARLGFTTLGEDGPDPVREALRRIDAEAGLDAGARVVMARPCAAEAEDAADEAPDVS